MAYNHFNDGRGHMLPTKRDLITSSSLTPVYPPSVSQSVYSPEGSSPYPYKPMEYPNNFGLPRLRMMPVAIHRRPRVSTFASVCRVPSSPTASQQTARPPPPPSSDGLRSWTPYSYDSNVFSEMRYAPYCASSSHGPEHSLGAPTPFVNPSCEGTSVQEFKPLPTSIPPPQPYSQHSISCEQSQVFTKSFSTPYHSSLIRPSGFILEEGEVASLQRFNSALDELPDDQISLVSEEDEEEEDVQSIDNSQHDDRCHNTHNHGRSLGAADSVPVSDAIPGQSNIPDSRYAFWITRIQTRSAIPGTSDATASDTTPSIVVFKMSNLDLSTNSMLLTEFIYHFLPKYRQRLNEAEWNKTYLSEVFLLQSQLTSDSLRLLLASLSAARFFPSALHLGSNSALGSEGMTVLADFILESKEPLRWLALSKCSVPLRTVAAFQKVLHAVLNRLDIYPREHNQESIPLWLDLPTLIDQDTPQHEPKDGFQSPMWKILGYLDNIRPGLYCQIRNRLSCGINRCGTPGSIFHIPKSSVSPIQVTPPTAVSQSNKKSPIHSPLASPHTHGELSEIDSDDDKENSSRSTTPSSPRIEATPAVAASKTDKVDTRKGNGQDTISLAYQFLLRDAFVSMAILAASHHILPLQFLRDMSAIYIHGTPATEVDVPVLWKEIPIEAFLQQMFNTNAGSIGHTAIRNTGSRKRLRTRPHDTLHVDTDKNLKSTFHTSSLDTDFSALRHTTKRTLCATNKENVVTSDTASSVDENPSSSVPFEKELTGDMSDKADQHSVSEEGEILDHMGAHLQQKQKSRQYCPKTNTRTSHSRRTH